MVIITHLVQKKLRIRGLICDGLILWKLSNNGMKMLNDIEVEFNSIQFQFNSWIKIQSKKNVMQIDEVGIENRLYENVNNNNLSLKRHLSMPLYLGWV